MKWGIFIVSYLGVGSKEMERLFWNINPMSKGSHLIDLSTPLFKESTFNSLLANICFIHTRTQSYTVPGSEQLGRVGYKSSNRGIKIKPPFNWRLQNTQGEKRGRKVFLSCPFFCHVFFPCQRKIQSTWKWGSAFPKIWVEKTNISSSWQDMCYPAGLWQGIGPQGPFSFLSQELQHDQKDRSLFICMLSVGMWNVIKKINNL